MRKLQPVALLHAITSRLWDSTAAHSFGSLMRSLLKGTTAQGQGVVQVENDNDTGI